MQSSTFSCLTASSIFCFFSPPPPNEPLAISNQWLSKAVKILCPPDRARVDHMTRVLEKKIPPFVSRGDKYRPVIFNSFKSRWNGHPATTRWSKSQLWHQWWLLRQQSGGSDHSHWSPVAGGEQKKQEVRQLRRRRAKLFEYKVCGVAGRCSESLTADGKFPYFTAQTVKPAGAGVNQWSQSCSSDPDTGFFWE